MKTNAEMTGRIIIGIGLFRDREVIKEDCVYGLLCVDLDVRSCWLVSIGETIRPVYNPISIRLKEG